MHFVYYLLSPSTGKTYVGRTSNLEGRLIAHNHESNKGFTKRYRPWIILYHETFENIEDASNRERYFKTGIGREFLKMIILQKTDELLGPYPPWRT